MLKKWIFMATLFGGLLAFAGCDSSPKQEEHQDTQTQTEEEQGFKWVVDRFADKRVLHYRIPDFDKLSLQQKKLVYYLTQAGLAGRDIMYDMNYRHNLAIRHAIDKIVKDYQGERSGADWDNFMLYAKNVWFSNGIHHHYSMDKFIPAFSKEYFQSLLKATGQELSDEVLTAMFDPEMDFKKVSLDPSKDLLLASAVNFYDPDISEKEALAYYKPIMDAGDKDRPLSYGINTKVVRRPDGSIGEEVWKVDGMYGPAIAEIVKWLEKAREVAENEQQKHAFDLLIQYYQTGDLKTWDDYNIAWAQTTSGDVDYINGFVEVYNDPLGFKGSYETIVQIKDFEATRRMKVLSENAQWFEDHAPYLPQHKKKKVKGITYNVVNVAGEAGDASPATPIGVNLPNANWIRAEYGSKSVSLGNIIEAYFNAEGPGMSKEFAYDEGEIERNEKYGQLADKLETALHEVIGHASGLIEPGVGTPKETLKNYASTLEEARADLVALYYIMDPKMVELGLMPNLEVGKAAYDRYILNGMMLQLRRIERGKDIEEAHMRNRQLIAAWALEKALPEGIITKEMRDGKTYFKIHDYEKLREIFGELLREVQRIKSQGDYQAGHDLVENYGVKVDPELHEEVLRRVAPLNIAPYSGFVNPRLVPVTDENGEITDVKVEYPDSFVEQMLEYAEKHSFLKVGQ